MRRRLTLCISDRPPRLTEEIGGAAVEFGLLLPVLLLLLIGIMDTGRLLWTRHILGYAVEQAARCAAVDTNRCATSVATQAYAASLVVGAAVPVSSFAVIDQACGAEVSVSHTFTPALPWLFPAEPTLSVRACFPR